MEEKEPRDFSAGLVVDETTIYEIDMDCYRCLPEREREKYFGNRSGSYPYKWQESPFWK